MPKSPFTAIVMRSGEWWLGWVAQVPGINAQAHTREELFEDLRAAMHDIFDLNRTDAQAFTEGQPFEEVPFDYCHEAS